MQSLVDNALTNKYVSTKTIVVQHWTMLSTRSVPRRYKEDNWSKNSESYRAVLEETT
jgi:hypothetical protein